ncbi:hypothetical protein QBC34DRAFT_473034 [Podospora aff. communis PSN243]|uniref:Uncharacterized protein n=1 Tax=Podospora aff. communis PSN243 TaxID=3040156 RepID=A0AAV9GDC8_9PEZI|nr:hypothetical protein QBC34DRAFT_473034 [Podospora aff. communis PSN243]
MASSGPQEHTPLQTEQVDHEGSDGDSSPQSSPTEYDAVPVEGTTWITGAWKRLPWLSLLSGLCTVACAVACIIVLRASDGANTEEWTVTPSVLVSIFTALGNASLRFALAEGFQMAWWRRATDKPRTISRLHEYYQHGTSALSAGLSLRHPSFIGVATLLVTILAIDGPILQRASSTALVVRETDAVPVSITLGTQLPYGFTGLVFAGDNAAIASRSLLNQDFASVFDDYNQRRPIPAAPALGSGCRGICEGQIEAMGLWKTCNSSEEAVVTPLMNETAARFALFNRTLFGVEWQHVTQNPPFFTLEFGHTAIDKTFNNSRSRPDDEPYILLNITYSPVPTNRSRSIFTHTCRLYSGTSRYPIRINNDTTQGSPDGTTLNTITITGPSEFVPGSVQDVLQSVASLGLPPTVEGPGPIQPYRLSLPTFPYYFPHPDCWADGCPLYETLGGLSSAVEDVLSAHVIAGGNPFGIIMTMTGALSNQLVRALPTAGIRDTSGTALNSSLSGLGTFANAVGWDDPTERIMEALDEIMLRAAVATAQTDVLRNVSWFYANANTNSVEAPPRNGTDAERYRLMPQPQQVPMRQTRTIQVFRSNYAFLVGGVAVMLVATIGVMPLFYGFWTLGREVSLSPVEMAKAFGAPVLEGSGAGVTAEAIARSEVGRVGVQYGEVVSGVATGTGPETAESKGELRLRFGREDEVRAPVGGRVYA